jgi:ferredoxin
LLHTPAFAFSPVAHRAKVYHLQAVETSTSSDQDVNEKLEFVAHKLKLQCYDTDTGVYGIDTKDFHYGIEALRVKLPFEPSLGLDLTEVAHGDLDNRGLVLVSGLSGEASKSPIEIGDTIIGVFAGEDFKESTTALNFEETMNTIINAKLHASAAGDDTIEIELNRLVAKAKIKLVVDDGSGKDQVIDALAGDNLRLVLMHHHLNLYDPKTHRLDQPRVTGDCGGEGICGTCLVEVVEGMDALNNQGPQEKEIMTGRPKVWRAACKTILGADNQEAEIKVRLHPQSKA